MLIARLRLEVGDTTEQRKNRHMPPSQYIRPTHSASPPIPPLLQPQPPAHVVASRGEKLEIMVFAINGPISVAPTNFLWFREAKIEVFR